MKAVGAFSILCVLLLPACAGAPSGTQSAMASVTPTPCPLPSPVPTPYPPVLLYPKPGATAVPDILTTIYFAGNYDGTYGPGYYTVTSSSNAVVPLGAPTIAPTPLPSPSATMPPNYYGLKPQQLPLLAALAPATSYTFGYVQTGLTNTPPNCYVQVAAPVGTFTTQ